ncbi:capsular biosynthesis protein, partial [filamentous cyanobacterium CCP4]
LCATVPEDQRQQCGYNLVANQLSVQLIDGKDSRIFRAVYSAGSEALAQYTASTVADAYLDYGLASRQRDIRQALNFLDEKLPEAQARVEALQNQLQNLRQANNLITPEARGGQLTGQISSFSQDYLAVQIELEETLKLAEDLQNQLDNQPQDAAASPQLSNSQRYQSIVQELLALDGAIAEASTLYLDNSPDMEVLQERRQNLLALLAREGAQAQRELLSSLQVLQSREAALASTLNSLNVDVNELASLSREYTDIERERTIATENLIQLRQKQETLELEAAQQELPWDLITPTTIQVQTESVPNNAVLGGLLGLLLGIGAALLRDSLKDTLHTPKDIKRITPVPILGLVPSYELDDSNFHYGMGTPATDITHTNGDAGAVATVYTNGTAPPRDFTAFQEAFRSLMANIRRVEAGTPIRSIAISSAEAEEGKSVTATYLAKAAAAMGERVLLVDGNLRFPALHQQLQISNSLGFMDVLTTPEALKRSIQKSPGEPNLYILPAGESAIDPSRALTARHIQQFIAKVAAVFDLVVIDTPSILEYADAQLIAAETSGVVLVSNLGQLKSTSLEQALERLWISNTPVLGIVAREESPRQAFQLA